MNNFKLSQFKVILLLVLFYVVSNSTFAQTTYTWNVATGDFSSPSSWSPSRTTPQTNDVLTFNGAVQASSNVINVRSQSIGRFRVINNATVTIWNAIPDTGTGTITRSAGTSVTGTGTSFTTQLRIGDQLFTASPYSWRGEVNAISSNTALTTGSAGVIASTSFFIFPRLVIKTPSTTVPSFEITTGSSLIINADSPSLAFSVDTGAFANISGLISFTGRPRLYGNDTNSIKIKSGGEVRLNANFLGSIFGLIGNPNIVTFDSGSVFRQRGGSNPFGLAAPATKVNFSSGTNFIFESTTGIPAFSGRTYANFIYRSPTSYSISGASAASINLLEVDSGTLTFALAGTLNLKGNIIINSPGNLVFAPTAGSPSYLFNGNSLQSISGSGSLSINTTVNCIAAFTLSNSNGLTLNKDVSFGRGSLTLDAGTLNLNGHTLTIGSDTLNNGFLSVNNGYLAGSGTLTKWFANVPYAFGNDTSRFPFATSLSTGRDLWISGTPTKGGTITVTHNNANGSSNFSTPFADNATNSVTVNVRQNTNWVVSTGNGFAGTGLSLRVQGSAAALEVTNATNLRLTLATGIAPGTAADGGGTSSLPQASRTGLTAANLNNTFYIGGNSTQNPLPVQLIHFDAIKTGTSTVNLVWQSADEVNTDRFEIEKSYSGNSFELLSTMKAQGNSSSIHNYEKTDGDAFKNNRLVYYRLKMIDLDGSFQYSNLVSVKKNEAINKINIINAVPNPTSGDISLNIYSNESQQAKIEVLDLKGSIIYTSEHLLSNGDNNFNVNMNLMNTGVYFVRLTSANEVTHFKIIKN